MIPLFLWRCPICATDDALVHLSRPLRADHVRCRRCHAEWRVRRVPGDNFYLKLIHVGQDTILSYNGDERAITGWYDAMKATARLQPIHDSAVSLSPSEVLYLASGPADLLAEETDPLFFPDSSNHSKPCLVRPVSFRAEREISGCEDEISRRQKPPPRKPVLSLSKDDRLSHPKLDKRDVKGKTVGRGRLFLTNRRLIWQHAATTRSFSLDRVNSAYAFVDYGLTLMVEMRLYTVRFLQESLLKWVTYIALVAPQVERETGHRIETSHF